MLLSVPLIWVCAVALASPMAIWKKLEYWTDWANLVITAKKFAKFRNVVCYKDDHVREKLVSKHLTYSTIKPV